MKFLRLTWIMVIAAVAVGGFVAYSKLRPANGATASAGAHAPQGQGNAGSGKARTASGGNSAATAVITAIAEEKDVPVVRAYVGSVEPLAAVSIRSRIDGVILTTAVAEGQEVKAGDVLFHLDDQIIQATVTKDRAVVAKDQATFDQANLDLTAIQILANRGDDTKQQAEQQQAAVKVAAAVVASDTAQLQADLVELGFATITAPIAGRIGGIAVSPGTLVHASDQTALLTITQMAPVRVSFTVPQRDLPAFRQAITASSPPAVDVLNADNGKPVANGKLSFIDSSVDSASGTVVLKADFPNADGALWPGEYVRVEAQLAVDANATVVPTASVQLNASGSFVFLMKPDGTVTRQAVIVGDTSGDTAVITSGLKPGDHVVTEGQLRLSEGSHIKEASASDVTSPAID